MRKIVSLAVLTALCGCTSDQQALLAGIGTIVVSDLCQVGNNQFSKLGNPTLAQRIAKDALDARCADPASTAALLIAAYNAFATKTPGAPKATVATSGQTAVVIR